eukprot:TRINITY_DN1324_c0_g3_i1.p1 TRINITY_DN1324_c0_g3~~TRINITY_DN1324_c0_g3_i1.p1  ORF type:complete len:1073 (-),score=292.52 TRINITY_DN1324_c0_g3_i1:865-4083(-)
MAKIDDEPMVEDMITLRNLSQESLLRNLRKRYEKNLIYTYTGSILVSVNPFQSLPIYTQEIVRKYVGQRIGTIPPHIFAIAEDAYCHMKDFGLNQSMIISGESGAGKTEATKLILQYLAAMTQKHSSIEQKIIETSPIMEAFGNARTVRNNNSSRFGKFMEIQFNTSGSIHGAKITQYLLEKSRIVHQAQGERNFHVFYMLYLGVTADERKKYSLHSPMDTFHYINQSGMMEVKGIKDKDNFHEMREAFTVLGMDTTVQNDIFAIVAAILHNGNLNFGCGPAEGDQCYVENVDVLEIVAGLLKVAPDQLASALTIRHLEMRGEIIAKMLKPSEVVDNRDALSKSVYAKLFEWLVVQINKVIETPGQVANFIGILDIFGFENFAVNSFEQMCIDYANEKLQQHFNRHIFKLEQEEYEREKINWSKIIFNDNQPCIDLIEKQNNPPGILSLLDEECRFPKSSDQTFLTKIATVHAKTPDFFKPKTHNNSFVLNHYAGQVEYQVEGFLEKNRDTLSPDLVKLMQASELQLIKDIFPVESESNKAPITIGRNFKNQLISLTDTLSATAAHYVRCIKPNNLLVPSNLDDELVLAQLRYAGMLETIRIRKLGYPIRYPCDEFYKRYYIIGGKRLDKSATDEQYREACNKLLEKVKGLEKNENWQQGLTKVFFKDAVFGLVEDMRNKKLVKFVQTLQGWWRMILIRDYYRQMRKNIIIIQKVVRGKIGRLQYLYDRRCVILTQAAARRFICFHRWQKTKEEIKEKRRQEELEKKMKEDQERKEREEKELKERMAAGESEEAVMKEIIERREKEEEEKARIRAEKDKAEREKIAVLLKKEVEREEKLGIGKKRVRVPTEEEKEVDPPPTFQRAPRILPVSLVKAPEILAQNSTTKYLFEDYANEHFNVVVNKGFKALSKGKGDLASMLVHSKKPIEAPLHNLDKDQTALALEIFSRILDYQYEKGDEFGHVNFILEAGFKNLEIRDEIYCQIIKQTNDCPAKLQLIRGWRLLTFCVLAFPPRKDFLQYLVYHLNSNTGIRAKDMEAGELSLYASKTIAKRIIPRRRVPKFVRSNETSIET